MFKCKNCNWEGESLSKVKLGALNDDKCPNCGDEVIQIGIVKEVLDLNCDGKVDHKDAKLASRVLNLIKKTKKGKK